MLESGTREVDAETTPLRNPENYRYDFPLADVTEVWRRGSVVASWLLDLTAISLLEQPSLEKFSGRVSIPAKDADHPRGHRSTAPAPVLTASLFSALSLARRRFCRHSCPHAVSFGGTSRKPRPPSDEQSNPYGSDEYD